MHSGRELAGGAFTSKEEPVANALCHDVVVLSALGTNSNTAVGATDQRILAPFCTARLHTKQAFAMLCRLLTCAGMLFRNCKSAYQVLSEKC